MDKLIDSPWFLRITALSLALLLFYNVQVGQNEANRNSSSDDMEVLRDVPVEVYYDDENLVVTGVPETVNMTIEGPTNIVQTTKVFKDFTLFVDLRSLPMGEHEVKIQHENLSDKLQVRIDPSSINVNVEEMLTETFRVDPEFNERLLAEGYNVTGVEVDPKTIEVTGAKSVIEAISFVKATVSKDPNIKESFEQEATVRVLDRDLNKLDVEIVPETVHIKVDIEENTKEVPIVLNETGTPQEGVKIQAIESEQKHITLSGSKRVLSDIDQLVVDFDVSKVNKAGTVEVKLKKPNDVLKLSFTTLKVKVDAEVEKQNDEQTTEEEEKEKENQEEARVSKFENVAVIVDGLDSKFKGTIIEPTSGTVTLSIQETESQTNELKQEDFTVMIDASDVDEEGEYTYPILVQGPPQANWTLSTEEAQLKVELA